MTDQRVNAAVTPNRATSDNSWLAQNATRDGAAVSQDWVMARAIEGRVFTANAGTATSPITFGAGSIDTTEPDLALYVPNGTVAILLEIEVHMEAYGTNALFEGMAATGTGGAFGTDTDVTPTSSRSDAPISSNCSAGAASNADATYMTSNVSEFFRFGLQKAVTVATADDDATAFPVTFRWSYKDFGPQVLVGDSSVQLMVFAAAQAGTGFITAKWVELPSSMVA